MMGRPRRYISARRARWLWAVGFRYSAFREAYVLRGIGNRYGPVFRVQPPEVPAPGAAVR